MNEGWIKLYRKITYNWIWEDKPFSYGQAWIHLILAASLIDRSTIFEGMLIKIQKGEIVTSELKLSNIFGWSRTKTRSFLEKLQNEQQINKISDNKKTRIIILNYDSYQESKTTKDTTRNTTEKQLKEQLKNTPSTLYIDKNIKNNNIYGEISKNFKKPTISEIEEYIKEKKFNVDATDFFNFYESKGWMVGKNKMKCWQSSVSLWNSNHGGQNGRNNGKSKRREFKQSEMDYTQTTWDD